MNQSKGKDFWGPPIWTTIHTLAATLNPEDAKDFVKFLHSLTKLLPCEKCRKNLKTKLEKVPPEPYLTNNHDAFFYTYLLHDMANEQITQETGVKKESPNFDEIKHFYFLKNVKIVQYNKIRDLAIL